MLMKKKVLTLCSIFVLLLSLSGCGASGSGNGKGKVNLTLWYWNRSISDKVIADVNKQFPNIHLTAQKIGGDFKAKLKTTLAAGSGGPDIVGLNSWVGELFPDKNVFVNLYDLGAGDVEDQYLKWKWQQGVTADGYMIGFPMDTGPTALFYRADYFKKAGLPTDPAEVSKMLDTWDKYFAAGKKIQTAMAGTKKVYLTDNISDVFKQIMAQGKTLYFNKNDQFIGDQSAQVNKAWKLAVEAQKDGLLAHIDNWTAEWNAAMNNGNIASFVGAVWMKAVISDAAPDTAGEWRVARAPGGDGNNGGSFLGILKQSKHPKEAFEVIRYLQNAQNQLRGYDDLALFPSIPSDYSSPKMTQPEKFYGGEVTGKIFATSAKNVKVAYFGPYYSLVEGIFTDQLTSVARQGKDPAKAWHDALHNIHRELSQ